MGGLTPSRRWVLETTLPQEECVRRLKSKLRGMWEGTPTAEKPLYGTVSSSRFAVQFSPGPGRGVNPYHVRGVFAPSAAGTTIRATYGVEPAYRIFTSALAAFFLGMFCLVFLRAWHNAPASLFMFLGGALFVVLFLAWRIQGMFQMVEPLREPILQTVAEILEARIVEDPETNS